MTGSADPSGGVREAALGISWTCAGGFHSLLRLLSARGPEAIWKAPHRTLLEWGVLAPVACRFETRRQKFDLKEAETALAERETLFVPFGSREYPRELTQLDLPPAGLFIRGTLENLSALGSVPRVTIVGTRKATTYGVRAAQVLAAAFASRGVGVVSGMALGVDGEAHRASLDAGGLTIAVLGCGCDVLYPRTHGVLYRRILEQGIVLSELPPGTAPEKWTFPRRNRILAALGDAAVVVEGSRVSGAMQTADWCAELGRPVFAVPGPIFIESHSGCNQLLYEGAGVAADPSVVVEDFFLETRIHRNESGRSCPAEVGTASRPRGDGISGDGAPLSSHLQSILVALGSGASSVDGLVEAAGLSARQVNAALAQLEVMGRIARGGPGWFIRAP